MEWYIIVLLAIAGMAALYFLAGFAASLALGFVLKKPMGRLVRPNYGQIRELCKDFDYSVYDAMEKEEFTIHHMGAELKCVFVPAPKTTGQAKCVISAHGFGLNLMFSARYVPMFHAMGYAAVIYDSRGLGRSTGASSLGYFEKHDMKATADWARQRLGQDAIIGVHGESLGAITSLETLGVDDNIAFAISDCCSTSARKTFSHIMHLPAFPFFSFLNLLSRLFYKADMNEVRPIERVKTANVPILFMHSTGDKPMPYRESEKLFAAASNPLSRLELFDSYHTGAYATEKQRYEQVAGEFIQAVEDAILQHAT